GCGPPELCHCKYEESPSALRPPRARKTPNRERPRHSRNSLPSRIHSTSSFAGLYLRLSAASHAGSCCFHWGFVGGSAGASVAPLGLAMVERVSTLNFL